jgi:hypothetical protein
MDKENTFKYFSRFDGKENTRNVSYGSTLFLYHRYEIGTKKAMIKSSDSLENSSLNPLRLGEKNLTCWFFKLTKCLATTRRYWRFLRL